MTMIDPEGLRYILDHITRQCSELKADIHRESGSLKAIIDREMLRQESTIQALKEENDERLALMDERIIDLQKFKWQSLSVIALVMFLVEIVTNWAR